MSPSHFQLIKLLAVVYGSFEEEEKKKFKKLFKHKLLVDMIVHSGHSMPLICCFSV